MAPEVKKPRKGVYLLPNMITTLSMFLGFLSMVWAVQGRFESACLAILLSAVMDGLDGKVARLTNTASEFGVQYDSLSDLVAFGIAPAMLMWQWELSALGRMGLAAAFIYAACGALRLARFNVSTAAVGKRFFIGLPIPAGGCTVVTFVFCAAHFPAIMASALPYMILVLAIGVGVLMVSKVRYFSFKEYDFLRAHPIRTMLFFLLVLGTVISFPRVMGFVLCAVYIIGGIVYTFVILPRRNRQLLRALSPQSD
ncbi:MAG: CDP-diacylglycerol--serine O-phosphatidyltransferase [Desulfovibrio desulfuricans]|nr:CDP-diacylglycerol--serine O-phosphatidyltransferase [Desulfovibrio desulfuricans]MDD3682631.1 CDP-diacylglycerol--serine O-phosphatidyltransferase [Desulfovibrio desulfuricans]QTO41910.1 CDP-diacylglycerol--serine O-phosphatidyltransferase [Desulfovibrio desulfuricans]